MKKYKIGEISKLTNIPVQTLRFYEEKGIIKSIKDKTNGYIYYDAWSINDLFDTLILKENHFSLNNIESILNTNSIEEMSNLFMNHEKYLLDKINDYKIILKTVSTQRQRIQNFKYQFNQFTECTSPDYIYFRFRHANVFQDVHGNDDLANLYQKMTPWFNAMPETTVSFFFPIYTLNENLSEQDPWWGFSLPAKDARIYQITPTDPNEYIPSCTCIYTVFEARDEGTFVNSFKSQVYDKIIKKGYIISGSVFGRLIIKTHENNDYKRYFEVWVPIIK